MSDDMFHSLAETIRADINTQANVANMQIDRLKLMYDLVELENRRLAEQVETLKKENSLLRAHVRTPSRGKPGEEDRSESKENTAVRQSGGRRMVNKGKVGSENVIIGSAGGLGSAQRKSQRLLSRSSEKKLVVLVERDLNLDKRLKRSSKTLFADG